MNEALRKQAVNIMLRGSSLASKFLLIVFLARFLEPSSLGLYGLVTATVGYSLYLLGFDFYTYSTREIIVCDRQRIGSLLKNQCAFFGVTYLVVIPCLLVVFAVGLLPWPLAIWFFVLLIVEHIGQELGRLLVAISRPMLASVLLFIRTGAWVYVVLGLMWYEGSFRRLETVLTIWAIGSGLSCILGVIFLYQEKFGGWGAPLDWAWIKKGLSIAVPLLVATLALRGMFTIDRYLVQALGGKDILGAYVLFMGLATALGAFLDAGVFVFIYPGLIGAHRSGDAGEFKRGMQRLTYQTLAISGLFSIVACLLIHPVLLLLGKAFYIDKAYVFYWVMLAMFLYSVGMIPHFGLYAQGKDRPIIIGHICSLAFFLAMVFILSDFFNALAVPFALCLSFLFLFLWKLIAYRRSMEGREILQEN